MLASLAIVYAIVLNLIDCGIIERKKGLKYSST
jgi:predicted transcriptional regulator